MPDLDTGGKIETDVVVIGAGLAGLSAATELRAGGCEVVVVEARERVGGRVATVELEGTCVDLGGQWIGPTQPRVMRLAEEIGADTVATYEDGLNVEWRAGRRTLFTGPIPTEDRETSAAVIETIFELERLAFAVPAEAPWDAEASAELDACSLRDWFVEQNVPDGAQMLMTIAARTVFGAEPAELSLLYVLAYIRSAGGFRQLIGTLGAAQDRRLADGAQTLAERLAEPLGENLILASPARAVEQADGGVRVQSDRVYVAAKRAIVALPPRLALSLDYSPALTPERAQLWERTTMGSTIKVHCIYDEPFWRADGLSGQLLSDEGPVNVTLDNSPADASVGALVAFIVGAEARAWAKRLADERRAAVLECLSQIGAAAREPRAYLEQVWEDEEWTGGCPVGYLPPGALREHGRALRRPEGRTHFAGTETATEWTGYMEGALQSGERAAREALEALGTEPLDARTGTPR